LKRLEADHKSLEEHFHPQGHDPPAAMTFILWILTSLVRWVRLKIYQYEVTFAIYMLTPTEKFIFST